MEEAADYAKNIDGQRGLSKEWVFPYKDQPIQRMNHADARSATEAPPFMSKAVFRPF